MQMSTNFKLCYELSLTSMQHVAFFTMLLIYMYVHVNVLNITVKYRMISIDSIPFFFQVSSKAGIVCYAEVMKFGNS